MGFEFTDVERYWKTEFRALDFDADGREKLVGLTFEQTVTYMEYSRSFMSDRRAGKRRSADEKERHKVYHDKHELARLAALEIARQRGDFEPK